MYSEDEESEFYYPTEDFNLRKTLLFRRKETSFLAPKTFARTGREFKKINLLIYQFGRSVSGNISLCLKNVPRPSAVFETLGNISLYGPQIW